MKCRVIAIYLIKLARRPPSWIFEEGVHGPFHMLQDLIFYLHTEFVEDILIGAVDMPPKRNLEKTPHGGGILLPVSRLTPDVFRGFLYVQLFGQIAQSAAELWRFN